MCPFSSPSGEHGSSRSPACGTTAFRRKRSSVSRSPSLPRGQSFCRRGTHGAEHLRDIMAGSILVVSEKEVLHAALFYGAIGIFHWFCRKQFLLVSMDRDAALKQGLSVQMWDFLFYLSFAIVITSSVR